MPLEEKLALDIADALRRIDQIESRATATFTKVAQSFKVGLADALNVLNIDPVKVEADATPVTSAIDDAVQAADTTIEPDDTSAITTGIDEAVDAADGTVPVEPDGMESITTGIDSAVDAADGSVPVEPVGQEAITAGIDEAVQAADATVVIEGDAGALTAELVDLEGAAEDATEGLSGATSATSALQAAGNAAANDLATVASGLSDVAGAAGDVIAVALTVGVAVGGAVSAALEAETAQRRYNAALDEFAERIDKVGVPGFADDLETLTERTGNSDEALKLAIARLFDLGTSSGVAGSKVAATSEQVSLLAIRASVLNPTLGDAGAITETLTGSLARGGRTLNDFGLSLTAAEIEARALADTNKRTADELTQYDRAAAGAALATERLGDRLRTDIVEAADQPAISLRRLREEFGNALEAFGQPLLDPLIGAARAAQPVMVDLAGIFAEIAGEGLPLLVTGLSAASPAIGAVGEVVHSLLTVVDPLVSLIDAIPEPLLTAVGSFLALRAVLSPLEKTIPAIGQAIANVIIPNQALTLGAAASTAAFTPWGLAIAGVSAALTVGLGVLASHTKQVERELEELEKGRKAFLDSADATDEYVESQIRSRIESENQIDDLTRIGLSVERFRLLLEGGRAGLEALADTMVRNGEITRFAADNLLGLTKLTGDQVRAVKAGEAGNIGLFKSAIALTEGFEKQSKAALDTLVSEGLLTAETRTAITVQTRRKNGTNDYAAAVAEANTVVRQQATEQIAAGRATDEAQAKNAALKSVYEDLTLVLKTTTEGTTASETAMARYGPALGAAVDQYVRGKPSIEGLAAIQAKFGIETELLSGVVDEHASKLEEAARAQQAFVDAGVEGLTSITEAGKILDEDTSFQRYLDRIRKTAEDQVAFSANIAKLLARGADDIARTLTEQGISAAGFAAELAKTGDKKLAFQETQLEKTRALFTQAETATAANGQTLVSIQTGTNSALGALPPPDLVLGLTAALLARQRAFDTASLEFRGRAAASGREIGQDFVAGLAVGFESSAEAAHRKAEAVVEETRRRARARAKAFSPSRVFAELGRDMIAGLVLGLSDAAELAAVADAADRMMLAAVPDLPSFANVVPPSVRAVAVAVPAAGVPSASTAGSVASPSTGSAVTVEAGGALVRMELHFGAGADRAAVTAGVKDSQGELVASLERLLERKRSR